ncbi:hypothetical protein F5H01DRAFT_348666 [Linnemannia elongata]|nr:hypothetical protein F5H01DRAFT_348666 [Linnemannia elongata]
MNIQLLQHRQSNVMDLLTQQRPRRNHPSSLPLLLLLFLSLLLLSTPSSFVNAATATTNVPALSSSTKPHATKSTSTLLPSPTPTPIIPEQCQGCYGPNNTSGMTCFKNTQCVPLQYLCDFLSSPTCSSSSASGGDGGGDGDNDNDKDGGRASVPILCQNQLCNPQNFPPLPYQESGRIDRTYCLDGSFYSLYSGSSAGSSTPKYTASCVEESMFLTTDGNGGSDEDCKGPWEYFAIGSCFLKTCGPGMDCVPPFTCQLFNSTVPGVNTNSSGGAEEGYGICVDPNGSSSSSGGRRGGINGGSAAPKYSAREYLLQGLLIGLCTLALGVGLGVGFWRYKRKKQFRSDHVQSHQQHRRRRTSSSHGLADHTHSRSHSMSSRSRDYPYGDGEEELDAESIPPPPPLQPLNNSGSSASSSSNSSTKKRPPTWHSFLLCGSCFGRRKIARATSRRVGGSRTIHSSSSLNRFSTLELDHHSHHPHHRTERRRGDSRAGESTETETDSQDDSSIHYHHHPHGRNPQPRWRWGQPNNANNNPMMMIMFPRPPSPTATTGTGRAIISASTRSGLTVVLPEFEPPPMYHRQDDENGPNLPTYGDISNSSSVDALEQLRTQQEQLQEQGQTESPLPPLPPPLSSTAAVSDPGPAQDQESSLDEARIPTVSSTSTRPTTPLPVSQPLSEPNSNPQQQ